MFQNYLKIAFRNIKKHKGYSFINIFGLASGIACCVLILLYVQDELSYDGYHQNAERVYRLVNDFNFQGSPAASPIIHASWGKAIAEDFPEVETVIRFKRHWTPRLIRYQDKQFYEEKFLWVDPEVLNVFSWELAQGNPQTVFSEPFSVVLTHEMAQKYFDDENPLGKTINFHQQQDYKITGVLKKIPEQSHFKFGFLASWSSLGENTLNNSWPYTYFLLHHDASVEAFASKLPVFLDERFGNANQLNSYNPQLQRLTDIHLHSHLLYEMESNSDIAYVYIFSVVALLILGIACFNFMNLATARSANRAREVGLRKVLGAQRFQLIKQFLGESLLFAVFALLLAIAIVELFLPLFNSLTEKAIDIDYFGNLLLFSGLLGTIVIIGIVAGSYPAMFLSAFQPVKTLKGSRNAGATGRSPLRKMLVVLQFGITVFLIIATLMIDNQLSFISNTRLGFDKEQIIVVPTRTAAVRQHIETIKAELLRNPNIANVSFATNMPGEIPSMPIMPVVPEGTRREDAKTLSTFVVDHDFIKTLDIEISEGRGFSREFAGDTSAFIVNEAAAASFGWENAIGKTLEIPNFQRKGQVVGVVKDFNFTSLHSKIEPVVIHVGPPGWFAVFAVKTLPNNIPGTIQFLEKTWQQLAPDLPFSFSFLQDDLNTLYQAEKKIGQIFHLFSFLAIFIGALGLFGLASFAAEQRTKEIGIRKVLGASVAGLIHLLTKDFLILVALSNLIAWPLAWLAVNAWLQDFAYRVDINLWIFLLSGGFVIAIALLTISYQTIKAALANPVKALRYE